MNTRFKKIHEILESNNLDAIALIPGSNFKYLTEKKFNVIGTDTSKDIIKKNKKNFLKYKNKFYLGDVRTLNFKENYFDAIISEASLYYQSIEDMKETIDEFYYILKPDRFLRIYTNNFVRGPS